MRESERASLSLSESLPFAHSMSLRCLSVIKHHLHTFNPHVVHTNYILDDPKPPQASPQPCGLAHLMNIVTVTHTHPPTNKVNGGYSKHNTTHTPTTTTTTCSSSSSSFTPRTLN
jgi:hypothetical protein